jgi:hypothetical protein
MSEPNIPITPYERALELIMTVFVVLVLLAIVLKVLVF